MDRGRLADAGASVLLIVDAQTRLLEVMSEPVTDRIVLLAAVAALLGIPALATQQNPVRLGPLAPPVRSALPTGAPVFDKTRFSCARVPALRAWLEACGRRQIVLAGVEAHVCVLQTAFELQSLGFEVLVAADAVSSRGDEDRTHALARLQAAGVVVTGSESVVFEWLQDAAHPQFRDVLQWLK